MRHQKRSTPYTFATFSRVNLTDNQTEYPGETLNLVPEADTRHFQSDLSQGVRCHLTMMNPSDFALLELT